MRTAFFFIGRHDCMVVQGTGDEGKAINAAW